jgi:hydrophobe/amphiphile efflux-1 (HAE1) family protein
MNVSAWSIRRPVPAILLFALLTVAGLWAFHKLPVQDFPDIDLPLVTVSASLDGAAPGQLETQVARPLEDAIAGIAGVEAIRTTLTEGNATITTEFVLEKPLAEAMDDVRDAVARVRADLPEGMVEPVVSKVTTTGQPLLTFTVAGGGMDEEALSWFVDDTVAKAVRGLPGVGEVRRQGGVSREVLVALDPDRLDALGVTAAQVSERLRLVQQDASGGEGHAGGGRQSFRITAPAETPATLEALRIPLADGRTVRLGEIATVSDGPAERTSLALLDGEPVVSFEVTRARASGELAVAAEVRTAVADLRAAHPGLRIEEAFDRVQRVQESYRASLELLIEGALLAVVVVWWFLRDWRATLISATALPLSVLPTFLVMQACGFSLNTVTFLALALVVGILVDDAIVEIENIARHLREGKSPRQAATEAADEIGLAVIATTFTLVAVFLPTAFMGGIPGRVFVQFGWTAAAAILASLAVARLLTPMMAAHLMRARPAEPERDSRAMAWYLRLADACLRHRWRTLAGAAAFLVGSLALIPLLPTTFIPAGDRALTTVSIELPPGATLERTTAAAEAARTRIADDPAVLRIMSQIGVSAAAGGGPMAQSGSLDTRKAALVVVLTPRDQRDRTQAEVERDLRARLADLPGARVQISSGGNSERLEVILRGSDAGATQAAGDRLAGAIRRIPGLGAVATDASLQRPELRIVPDPLRAAEAGVTTAALMQTVRIATAGDFAQRLAAVDLPTRRLDVRVRLADSARNDPDRLARIRVPGSDGPVPLGAVADLRLDGGPVQIRRLDRLAQTAITVELNGQALGAIVAAIDALPEARDLPPGVSRQPSGEVKRMRELFGSFGTAMAVGVFCIYAVLVLLLHRFLLPLTILSALPLSVGGALAALLVSGHAFSMPSVIGLIMLMGIVTKNSILLVDYAVMAQERGLDRHAALLDACRKRVRPIVMTTLAMGAGMLPIALGWGADPSFRSPMGVAVIGGLITSTVLSLVVVPATFTVIDDLGRVLGRKTP